MKNVREEIEQAVTRGCSYEEFNPIFEDLYFSLNFLDELDGLKVEKYDIYSALMTAYSIGFSRGKKAHRPVKWIETENQEFDDYWKLYKQTEDSVMRDFYGANSGRSSREFSALVARRMYENGIAEEKSNWTA